MKKPEKRTDKGVTRAAFFRTFSGEYQNRYPRRSHARKSPEAASL